jgi:hypothetical protein
VSVSTDIEFDEGQTQRRSAIMADTQTRGGFPGDPAEALTAAGGPVHRLLAALDQAGRHTGLPLVAGPVASDNRRYAAAGLAAVGIGAGMAGYHSPADTPDRVETDTLTAITRLVVATSWLVATDPATVSSVIGD